MSLQRGVELFNRGLYWEAHEAWEEAWVPDRYGPDRGFYKGLIQVAAGCLHYGRHNRRGAVNKWRSGADYLRPYLPRHHGIELALLLERVDGFLSAMDEQTWPGGLEMPILEGLLDRLVSEGRAVAPTVSGPLPLPPVIGDPTIDTARVIEEAREEERW